MWVASNSDLRYNFPMILQVRMFPDPVLRQVCEPVTVFDAAFLKTVNDMFETMHHFKGVGLAASQVGILKQFLVLEYEGRRLILTNPVITASFGSTVEEEGCLSLPNVRVPVTRAHKVEVSAVSKVGKPFKLKEKGFIARIIQHEIDHLHGRLITDHTPLP